MANRIGGIKTAIVLAAVVIATASWVGVLVATDLDGELQLRQAQAQAANLALVFEEQVYRQILSIDQTLRILKADYERDPTMVDAVALQRRAGAMSDLVSQVLMLDYRGRVVASTRHDLLDSDMSSRRFFTAHRSSDSFGPLITGPFQSNGQWFLNISRRLNARQGVFSGVVAAGYDLNALMRDMAQADLGPRGLVMLVGRDGTVRAISLRGTHEPGNSIAGSAMFKAMFTDFASHWTGPSPADGSVRLHAFRAVPGQDMTLVVGIDRGAALARAELRKRQALLGASAVTLLVMLLAFFIAGAVAANARERQRLAHDRAVLAAANRQLSEARERANEKSLQLGMTLAGMSDGISMFSPDLLLVQWNTQFGVLVGLPPDTLRIGMPLEEVLTIQARAGEFGSLDDPAAEVARQMDIMHAGEWPAHSIRTRPNGQVVELRRTRLPDGGWVTLYTDVTARKIAEDAQNRAREQAETAAQEKSRFVAIVSHEIRTPLNVALNSLGLLDRTGLDPAQQRLVDTGLMAGESLKGLLNDILDLSRMQVGRMQLRPTTFDLAELADGVAEMFRQQAAARGVVLGVAIGPGVPPRLNTDAGRLRQALMNLVSNAAKFAEPGPASIRIDLASLDDRAVLRLAVRDSGPEIPDLDRDRLFRPFSQLERTGTGGTGLGLAICQLLANLLGGQIGCDPVAGGKEFWLTLPADAMAAGPAVPAPPRAEVRWLPRTRVLVIEDVLANQMVVATMLRREGHMVDVASSGFEGIEKAASAPYDLILLDIFMPGIDGKETARRLRALPGSAGHVPVVALTANVSGSDRHEYEQAGMVDLLPKPVDRAAMLGMIARHVWAGHRGVVAFAPPAAPPAPPPPAPARPEPAVPRIPALDMVRLEAWREGLPDSVSNSLLQDCLRQLRSMVPPLDAALRSGDAAALRQAVHAIGGVAGNYGLSGLEAAVNAVRAGDPAQAAAVLAEIDRAEAAALRLPQAA